MAATEEEIGKLYRSLMTPLAERHGLDYAVEALAYSGEVDSATWLAERRGYTDLQGTSDARIAFALAMCGADLLGGYRERGDIPTGSKRVARRVAKWIERSYRTDAGREAAIFLAQAMGVMMSRVVTVAGHPEAAETHLELVDLVQRHYPLTESMRSELLDEALVEYEVFRTGEAPDFPRNGYHMALQDGVDPDEELVEMQATFAGQYFRHSAGLSAIRLAIGEKHYVSVRGDLMLPGYPSYESMMHSTGEGSWWGSVAEKWGEIGRRYLEREGEGGDTGSVERVGSESDEDSDATADDPPEVIEVVARYPDNVPEPMAKLMRLTIGYATDILETGLDDDVDVEEHAGLAMSLATLGYLYRQVQVEGLPGSRAPLPDLTVKLMQVSQADPKLAGDWGSVMALAAAEQLNGMDLFGSDDSPQIDPVVAGRLFDLYAPGQGQGGLGDGESSRCFEFGWLLRCFEDSLPSEASV